MSVEIRPGSAGDRDFIKSLLRDWHENTAWVPDVYKGDEFANLAQLLVDRCDTKILEGPNGPLGFIAMQSSTIQGLFVAPSERGKGIGGFVINHLKETYKELRLWVLEANHQAIEFYEALGFQHLPGGSAVANEFDLPEREYRWRKHV